MTKLRILSIDAWRDTSGGWYYNASYAAGFLEIEEPLTARRLLKALREQGFLTEASKGRVQVEEPGTDPEAWEIQDRGTGEPLFLLQEEEQ